MPSILINGTIRIYWFICSFITLRKKYLPISIIFFDTKHRPLRSFLDLVLEKQFLLIFKNGLHVDSLIKKNIVTFFNKLNTFSKIVLDSFLVQYVIKKAIQMLWDFCAVLTPQRRQITSLFLFFWYISALAAVFYFFI